MGTGYLNELLDMYDQVPNTQEDSDQDSSTTSSSTTSSEANLETPINVEQTLRQPEVIDPEAEGSTEAASPLTDEGKAIVEQALSGQLIKGYTAKFTREQWDNMSRKERKDNGLPESRLGIVGFDFKEDIDKMLEKPLRNLNIKRNIDPDKEYKIKIKGKGTYTVTGNQLSTMDDAAFTMPFKPSIEITEYKEGDSKAKKITQRILERYQRAFKEEVQEEKDSLGPTNPNM